MKTAASSEKKPPASFRKTAVGIAVAVMILLAGIAITGSLALQRKFAVVLDCIFFSYRYSLVEEDCHLDVMMVSAGFLLRAGRAACYRCGSISLAFFMYSDACLDAYCGKTIPRNKLSPGPSRQPP